MLELITGCIACFALNLFSSEIHCCFPPVCFTQSWTNGTNYSHIYSVCKNDLQSADVICHQAGMQCQYLTTWE